MPRLALRVVQTGAIAVVLIALPYTVFDLDRFLIPKELILHLTAILGCAFAFGAIRRLEMTRVDWLLAGFVLFGVISALFATNPWLALRAVAVSASSVALYWIGRALSEVGLQRPLLNAIALAVGIAAIAALLQAYGLRIDFFAMTRVPGGTLGNRNFVAHVMALGLPVCMLVAWSSRFAMPGVALVTAALVLTRSRAAWLGCAAMIVIFVIGVIAAKQWKRFTMVLMVAAIGASAALVVPNALHWRSENPYLQSMQGVANYQEGSGRGRLVQYSRSLLMALRHPLFGVGPGNWPVSYPAHVPRSDPSLDQSTGGMTYNPWPSSDWIAFISERGIGATVLLALALIGISVGNSRPPLPDAAAGIPMGDRRPPLSNPSTAPMSALLRWTALAIVAAVVVEGLFDAVLLLAVPALLVWTALGALQWRAAPLRPFRSLLVVGVIVVSLAGAAYTAAEINSMTAMARGHSRAALERASRLDPGNFLLHMRLAQGGRNRCAHATAAHALFPESDAAARLSRGCR